MCIVFHILYDLVLFGFNSSPVGIRTPRPYLLYLWGFEDTRLNDEHAIELIILKFDNSGLIKDLLDLSFPLLPQPEADIVHIGS